ncbi:MAG: DUF7115 domain-containing protein [Halobacteriota archaeon]
MSQPDIVQSALDDEPVAARVNLGGEDELLVTPSRTLVYRAEGLLSDESVKEYPHGAERIEVSEGRRKSKISLDYGLDGTETIAMPSKKLKEALHPVLAGVLNAAGITDPGETVKQTFRFSELTLVITSDRVVKHIGAAVWDEDFEEFHYDDVTDLTFEDGSVATSIVIAMGDRQERFKAPKNEARAVREGLEAALLTYHDVESLEEFRVVVAPSEDEAESDEAAKEERVSFGEGPDPLSADPSELSEPPENATRNPEDALLDSSMVAEALETEPEPADGTFESSGFESAGAVEASENVAAQLSSLTEAVERQQQLLESQQELIQQLIEELRQGR